MLNTFKALSDENRRKILMILKDGEQNVGEILKHFDMTDATLSYHLNILKKANLIKEIKNKNFRYYKVNTTVFEEVISYLYQFSTKK